MFGISLAELSVALCCEKYLTIFLPQLRGVVSAITTSRWGKSLLFTMPRRGIISSKTPGLKFVSDMGYLLQLRRSGKAAHKINSCVYSFLLFILQIILIQFTEGTFATALPISSLTATTSFSVHVMCARNCLTWVSWQALRKVQDQRRLIQKPHKATCSQTFTTSYALPCSHTLQQLEDQRQSLLLLSILIGI